MYLFIFMIIELTVSEMYPLWAYHVYLLTGLLSLIDLSFLFRMRVLELANWHNLFGVSSYLF